MRIHFLILGTFLILFGCGKVQQMKLSGQNNSPLNSSEDVRVVEVNEGKVFKGETLEESYLEFNQKQYPINSIDPIASSTWDNLAPQVPTSIYFKGSFTEKPSGIDPQVKIEVIDLSLLKLK